MEFKVISGIQCSNSLLSDDSGLDEGVYLHVNVY